MSIPKQDERAQGLPLAVSAQFPANVKDNVGTVVAQCWADGIRTAEDWAAFIVQACNAYGSTDALRSALAKIVHLASEMPDDPMLDRLSSIYVTAYAALSAIPAPSNPPMETEMTDAQIKHMVDRFLMWKLPAAFNPDGGISFERIAGASGPHPFVSEPVGTNLFSADQAAEMVRHMLEGLPSASPAPPTEGLRELASEARFLLNRLSELSFDDLDDHTRDFNGHVEPSVSRLGKILDAIEARTALAGVTAPVEGK